MEERPPRRPREAWEESGAPREGTPSLEPYEVTEVQPLHADAGCLPPHGEEDEDEERKNEEAINTIERFLRSTGEDDTLNMMFLESICTISSIGIKRGWCERVATFCHEKNLAEKVMELLENKPMLWSCTAMRQQAMAAIAALSEVNAVSEDEIIPLSNVCCNIIFILAKKDELKDGLYDRTLNAMDNMLQMLMLNSYTSGQQTLENILEVLRPFSYSPSKIVREKAMERIWKLYGSTDSSLSRNFGRFLLRSQRIDFIRMTLEKAAGSRRTEDYERAQIILDRILKEPRTWLKHDYSENLEVPEILWSINGNLKTTDASLHETFFSAAEILAYTFPREVLKSALIHLPQCDSTTLDIWRRLLASNSTSGKVVLEEELCKVLQDHELCTTFNITTMASGFLCLIVSCPTEESLQVLRRNTDLLPTFLKIKSFPILWLVLRGFVHLSERPETVSRNNEARRIRTLLPDILQALQFDNVEVILKALNIFRNVVNHVGKMEACPVALELADRLLHLFNHEASEIRECSIQLFRDVIEAVAWWQKGKMEKRVLRSLVPLLLRKKDETLSVARASGEAFVACAKFLKWNKLERQAQEDNDPFTMMECLVRTTLQPPPLC
ncbi:hypothetical protein ASZ78_013552 [Callipepla squamata]|uniref:Uncharacterized protein n=1 Tax=Callipepla squamata TaxID=9009 RepID=A0A226NH96_CALSU|nr:hypothetical protein ASZ78_013552 [Callipepla squamata]